MSTSTDGIAERIWTIFSRSKPKQRKEFKSRFTKEDLNDSERPLRYFSPFVPGHMKEADSLYGQFLAISLQLQNETDALTAVLDLFDSTEKTLHPDLRYYVLELYLVQQVKQTPYYVPSIFITNPEMIVPSREGRLLVRPEVAVGSDDETLLDWFREDPLLNEHHGHWHIVYARNIKRDRQGEMFFYMHRQMLARYQAERLAAKIPEVTAFADLSRPIKVGYAAGEDTRLSAFIGAQRDPGAAVDVSSAADQKKHLTAVSTDINKGIYDPANLTDEAAEISAVNLLGSTLESNVQGLPKDYSSYHGSGHVYIGNINDGVMLSTATAIRDVVFWEWHQGIDDLYEALINRLPKHQLFADAPPVNLRKSVDANDKMFSPDIILCQTAQIDGFNMNDATAIGAAAFGGANWNKEFADGVFDYTLNGRTGKIATTNELMTSMQSADMKYVTSTGEERRYTYSYLNHEPFVYFIRVENDSALQIPVTIRIFLVPEEWRERHERWIEMDKFRVELKPLSKNVIFRSDTQSSVIRKPAVVDPTAGNTRFDPTNINIDPQRCDCGWPYHLLLPGGRGNTFCLMVMVTDGNIDMVGNEPDCGSLSFCGAKNNLYPDRRPLGYPFNRSFAGNQEPISEAIRSHKNMACRVITIN